VKNIIVSASKFAEHQFHCPACGSGNVVMQGRWVRSFLEQMENGVRTGLQIEQKFQPEYTGVLCRACGVHADIESDTVVAMTQELIERRKRDAGMVEAHKTDQVM